MKKRRVLRVNHPPPSRYAKFTIFGAIYAGRYISRSFAAVTVLIERLSVWFQPDFLLLRCVFSGDCPSAHHDSNSLRPSSVIQ